MNKRSKSVLPSGMAFVGERVQALGWRRQGLVAVVLTLALSLAVLWPSQVAFAEGETDQGGLIATYDTGLGDNGAEILAVRDNWGVLSNADDGSVDILDLSDLTNITLIQRIKRPELEGLTSVAIHPYYDYFIAVAGSSTPAANPTRGKASIFRLSDGQLLRTVQTGIQPDAVSISPNGRYALIANEAEGYDIGDNGGDGSLTLIDLRYFHYYYGYWLYVYDISLPSLAGLPGASTGRTDDAAKLPVDNTPGTLEPELISWSADGWYAFVVLQENNIVIRMNFYYFTWRFFGLGQTTHEYDLIDDGQFQPNTTASFYREPDGIAVAYTNNQTYFVTADEGDTSDANGNGGPRGGRTVSVFSAGSGELVGDTGGQIDAMAAAMGIYPDGRSNRGGSEPENLDAIRYYGSTIVAVGLERADAVAFVDITDPANPHVFAMVEAGDAPEGIKLLIRNYKLYALSANEGDGTISVIRVPSIGLVAAEGQADDQNSAAIDLAAAEDFVADESGPDITILEWAPYQLFIPQIGN